MVGPGRVQRGVRLRDQRRPAPAGAPAARGQLMALAVASRAADAAQRRAAGQRRPLRAPGVGRCGRPRPQLTGAQGHRRAAAQRGARSRRPNWSFAASAEPAGKAAPDEAAQRALHFDLGGVLPLVQVDLQLRTRGTRVAPVRLQGAQRRRRAVARARRRRVLPPRARQPTSARSPPLALHATAALPARAARRARRARSTPAQTRLVVQAPLASLVFAAQGQPPYALLAGARGRRAVGAAGGHAGAGARRRTRRASASATLGEWSEVSAVARAGRGRSSSAPRCGRGCCGRCCWPAWRGWPSWSGGWPDRRARTNAQNPERAAHKLRTSQDCHGQTTMRLTTRQFLQDQRPVRRRPAARRLRQERAATAARSRASAPAAAPAPAPAKVYVVGTDAAYAPFEIAERKGRDRRLRHRRREGRGRQGRHRGQVRQHAVGRHLQCARRRATAT